MQYIIQDIICFLNHLMDGKMANYIESGKKTTYLDMVKNHHQKM